MHVNIILHLYTSFRSVKLCFLKLEALRWRHFFSHSKSMYLPDELALFPLRNVSLYPWQCSLLWSLFCLIFSSVQWLKSCPTLCDPMECSTPGLPVHHQLPKFTQTHVHWVGDAIQPFHPLSSPSPPAFNPSQHQVISNELVFRIRWPKYWRFSFSISPSNEYLGLISFRNDWFDLLAV